MHKLLVAAAALSLLMVSACKSTKKATAAPVAAEKPVVRDTVAATSPTPAVQPVYHASNTRLSDILHTRVEVSFDWTNSRMNGKAQLTVKPYFYPTDMLYLNARGMEIRSLEVFEQQTVQPQPGKTKDKAPAPPVTSWSKISNAAFKYENDSLRISLGRVFRNDETYRVNIEYVARPEEIKTAGSNAITDDKGLYFINPKGENKYKMPQIWTQGETQATSVWMPTIDSPNEKFTQEILMTVEDKFTTLSNGVLASSVSNGNGTRTDQWVLDQPHSPYLAMMAVGEFVKVTGAPWNGKEVSYYVEKQYKDAAEGSFGHTPEMIEFFSTRLGVPYPWPKYAQIVVRDYVSGAMENTSATLHGDFVIYQTYRELLDNIKGTDVISHELFHQWFGDLATAESWSNLPLNESFATYGEYLWREYKDGRDAADYHGWQSRQGYLQSTKEVDLIRFDYADKEDMFDAFSYNKGGQVLHMLRKAVGDDAFFASLKNYLVTNEYKPAEIHHLRLAFESTTGRDMNWFFNQWFLNKGRPKLRVTQKYENNAVELTVEQLQDLGSAPLYILPLDIDIYDASGKKRHPIVIDQQRQVFRLPAEKAPLLVNFDAERQLLCELEYRKSRAEYIYQYTHAPLLGDRLEALQALADAVNEPDVFAVFSHAAIGDRFYELRRYAIARLEKVKDEKALNIKSVFMQVYNNDKKTLVKARALEALNRRFLNDADVIDLTNSAVGDESYAVAGQALTDLTRRDPKMALEKAKRLENEMGKDIIFAIANLYSYHGSDQQMYYFRKALPYVTGFDMITFLSSYARAAKRSPTSEEAIAAAMDFEIFSTGSNKYTRFAALKSLKELAGAWDTREKTARSNVENLKRQNQDATAAEAELTKASETHAILEKMYNRVKS